MQKIKLDKSIENVTIELDNYNIEELIYIRESLEYYFASKDVIDLNKLIMRKARYEKIK